jgi:hypothetical protein
MRIGLRPDGPSLRTSKRAREYSPVHEVNRAAFWEFACLSRIDIE